MQSKDYFDIWSVGNILDRRCDGFGFIRYFLSELYTVQDISSIAHASLALALAYAIYSQDSFRYFFFQPEEYSLIDVQPKQKVLIEELFPTDSVYPFVPLIPLIKRCNVYLPPVSYF
jgi:hypothetical protein